MCALAIKALVSKKNTTLYNNVGEKNQLAKEINFIAFVKGEFVTKGTTTLTIKWNPLLKVKHLDAILAADLPHSTFTTKVSQLGNNFDYMPLQETVLDKEDSFPIASQGIYINTEQHIRL